MLIDLSKVLQLWEKGGAVIHVGAHLAEERDFYRSVGLVPRIWVEAQSALVSRLREKLDEPDDLVIQGAVWHTSGQEITLNIANNSQSSSVLEFGTHRQRYPETNFIGTEHCLTLTLGSILVRSKERVTLVNLDIQGTELEALKGAGKQLIDVPLIYTEVNFESLYEGCALVGEIDDYLAKFGFCRTITAKQGLDGWGDALYVREADLTKYRRLRLGLIQALLDGKYVIRLLHGFMTRLKI